MQEVLNYLMQAGITTGKQILLLLGPLLALSIVMNQVSKFFENRIIHLVGIKGYIALFGWIGIPAHEMGHAIFAKLFGHDITEMKLFEPDMNTGQMGYVSHSYNPRNPYHVIGNFFIGIGPLLMGAALILLIMHFLAGEQLRPTFEPVGMALINDLSTFQFDHLSGQLVTLFAQLVLLFKTNITQPSWQFWLAIFLIACIGSGMTLSMSDVKSAFTGFLALAFTLFVINMGIQWAKLGSLDHYFQLAASQMGPVYIAQLLAILLLLLMVVPFAILGLLKK